MRVPIKLDQTLALSRRDDLLLGGVPLPRGQVRDSGWMNLLAGDGSAQAVHARPAAYWPDGSIKWLHLCGKISCDNALAHVLELDTEVLDPSPERPRLQVERRAREVRVAGGPLRVRFGPEVPGLLRAATAGGSDLDVLGLSPELVVIGPEDDALPRVCRFRVDDDAVQIPVESPNRVVLRLSGRWLAPNGAPMAELRLFVEVLSELSELRLQPVLIYLGDSERDLIRRCELKVETNLREAVPAEEETLPLIQPRVTPVDEPWPDPRPVDSLVYGFGEQQGAGYWDRVRPFVPLVRWPAARQVQVGSSFYRIEKRVAPGRSWVKACEGRQARGWCHLNNGRAGVTAAIRNFWQEHPTALEVDAGTGVLTFGFWPDSAEPLDLRRYSLVRHGTEGYEYGIGLFPLDTHGPAGIGKARELALQFHDRGAVSAEDRREVARRAMGFLHPLYPLTPGDYFAQTRVVGRIAAATEAAHAETEKKVAELIDFLALEQRRRGWYGLMNFGDMPTAFYSGIDRWGYDDGGYGWVNTEHLPDLGLWLNSLRAGRRDWLDLAVNMTRHNRDVDTFHAGPFLGSGSRHNVQHWGCADKEWRVSMPLVRRLHYYVCADPWTAEVIRNTVELYRTHVRTSGTAPSMASAMIGLAVKWEMSGNPADRKPVERMADLYASAFRDDGQFYKSLHVDIATGEGYVDGDEIAASVFFFDGFGGQHMLCELAEMLQHEKLAEALVRYSLSPNYGPSRGPGEFLGRFVSLALAYRRRGSPEYLDKIRETLPVFKFEMQTLGGDDALDEPPHASPVGMERRNKYVCGIARYLSAVPYGLSALTADT